MTVAPDQRMDTWRGIQGLARNRTQQIADGIKVPIFWCVEQSGNSILGLTEPACQLDLANSAPLKFSPDQLIGPLPIQTPHVFERAER